LSLGEVATEEKSNEITTIPVLLRLIDISGVTITIDAMGTQTAIAEQIVEGGGDYGLALKRNQPGLSDSVQAYAEHHARTDYAKIPAERHVTKEKGHGRIEHREYVQSPVPDDLPDQERWSGLKTIGMATLTCTRNGKETTETRLTAFRAGSFQHRSAVYRWMSSGWPMRFAAIGASKIRAIGAWT